MVIRRWDSETRKGLVHRVNTLHINSVRPSLFSVLLALCKGWYSKHKVYHLSRDVPWTGLTDS